MILDIIFYYIFNTFLIVSIDIKKYVIIAIVAVVVENKKYPVDTATPHCFQPLYSQAIYRVIFFFHFLWEHLHFVKNCLFFSLLRAVRSTIVAI